MKERGSEIPSVLQEVLDDSAQISAELQKQADEMNSRLDEEEDIVTDDIDTIIKIAKAKKELVNLAAQFLK